MTPMEKRIELLKIIAHPERVKILEELMHGVKCVCDFKDSLDISELNMYQHLEILRANGAIDFFVDGVLKCYFLKDPFISDLFELLKKQYKEYISTPASCRVSQKGSHPGERRRPALMQKHTITLYVNDPMESR